ncbi:MAG: hypothetical protein Q9219_001613 [cf. Caloplaca sp. 3 TL-2023]
MIHSANQGSSQDASLEMLRSRLFPRTASKQASKQETLSSCASPPAAVEAATQPRSTNEVALEAPRGKPAIDPHASRDKPSTKPPSTPSRHEPEYTADGEPRLPSTPVQLGLEPSPEPSPGLLASRYSRGRDLGNDRSQGLPRSSLVKLQLKYHALEEEPYEIEIYKITDWAKDELGPILRGLTAEKDLIRIRETVTQYWKLAKDRAQCWTACEQNLPRLITPHSPPRASESPDPLQENAVDTREYSYGRQNVLLRHDTKELTIGWKILPGASGRLKRAFTISHTRYHNGVTEPSRKTRVTEESLHRLLLDKKRSVLEVVTMVAQSVFGIGAAEL